MQNRTRRYLFAAWADVERLDFEYLEKVCDRFFILVPESLRQVPFPLVKRLQRLGKGVKWIAISENALATLPMQLAFLMGKLHQKLPADIEFAILSDDESFDPLVQFIFEKDRNCFRIRVSKAKETLPAPENEMAETVLTKIATVHSIGQNGNKKSISNGEIRLENTHPAATETVSEENNVKRTASDVIERLIRTGNRPQELTTLKQYISLSSTPNSPGLVEKVVTFMAMNNEIEIQEKEVVYHF